LAFGLSIIRYVCDGRTDRQTDGQKQRLLPLPYGRGHNNSNVMSKTQPVWFSYYTQ